MRREDRFDERATPVLAKLANCKTRTGYFVDMDVRQYRTFKVITFWPQARLHEYLQTNPQNAVQIKSNTVDTGERETFFGYSAKHLITTNKRLRDKNSGGGEEIIDGWYIDHEPADEECAPDFVRTEPYYVIATFLAREYPELPEVHHTGPLSTGLEVKSIRTILLAGTTEGAASKTITFEDTVEDLSDLALSPSLFELPAGLHENPDLFRPRSSRSMKAGEAIIVIFSFVLTVCGWVWVFKTNTVVGWIRKNYVRSRFVQWFPFPNLDTRSGCPAWVRLGGGLLFWGGAGALVYLFVTRKLR
jgi:hypothetical protein